MKDAHRVNADGALIFLLIQQIFYNTNGILCLWALQSLVHSYISLFILVLSFPCSSPSSRSLPYNQSKDFFFSLYYIQIILYNRYNVILILFMCLKFR